jgi:ArsR family transcriptional regulator
MMQDILSVLAAMAEPTRLSAMRLLWDGDEHCVCELMRKIDASQSRMSRHMGALRSAGLVIDRRDAQWVRYRVNPALAPATRAIVEAVMAALPLAKRNAA